MLGSRPRGAIDHPTQPHVVFGNHARLFALLERLAELRLMLPLMPTQEMYDPVAIEAREAHALRVLPLPPPPLRSRAACSPRAMAPHPTPNAPL